MKKNFSEKKITIEQSVKPIDFNRSKRQNCQLNFGHKMSMTFLFFDISAESELNYTLSIGTSRSEHFCSFFLFARFAFSSASTRIETFLSFFKLLFAIQKRIELIFRTKWCSLQSENVELFVFIRRARSWRWSAPTCCRRRTTPPRLKSRHSENNIEITNKTKSLNLSFLN